jgi:hypothetical protein
LWYLLNIFGIGVMHPGHFQPEYTTPMFERNHHCDGFHKSAVSLPFSCETVNSIMSCRQVMYVCHLPAMDNFRPACPLIAW